jgi:hypothetical protein
LGAYAGQHLPAFLRRSGRLPVTVPSFIVGASSDGRYFVDQSGQPRLLVGEDSWCILANGGAWNSDNYQATFDSYFAQRAAQGYTACEVVWCSFPAVSPGLVNTDGRDWDGVWPFAGNMDPTTAANATFWARRDYFIASAARNGITVILNTTTTMLGNAGTAQTTWSTAQWQAFGTFLGSRYKNTPNLMWIVGDDYFGDQDAELGAWLTSLRATGDTHLASIQLYQEGTSRQDLSSLTKDPLAWCVHAQYEWVYTYNVTYDGIERAQTYVPTGSDDVQHVVPPVWGDGHYLNSGVSGGQTDERLERQMVWWALSSGAAGISTGDEAVWTWPSTAAAALTGHVFYTWLPNIVRTFSGLTAWHELAPDTSSALVTAGRGTHAAALTSGGGGGSYGANTDNYVTASRSPDTGSGSSLAVIYCGLAMNITIDETKMRSGYSVTWADPVSGATFAGTPGSTYNSTTARGNNSAGDPDWVLILRG